MLSTRLPLLPQWWATCLGKAAPRPGLPGLLGPADEGGGRVFLGAASYWQDASQGCLLARSPDEGVTVLSNTTHGFCS